MGQKAKTQKCKGMEGLVKEGSEILKEEDDIDGEVKDAALIAAAQRVEHYEIAGYGTVRTYANLLGENEAANLLQQTLDEEKEADQTLNEIAEQINVEAGHGEVEEEGASRRTRTVTRSIPAALRKSQPRSGQKDRKSVVGLCNYSKY